MRKKNYFSVARKKKEILLPHINGGDVTKVTATQNSIVKVIL